LRERVGENESDRGFNQLLEGQLGSKGSSWGKQKSTTTVSGYGGKNWARFLAPRRGKSLVYARGGKGARIRREATCGSVTNSFFKRSLKRANRNVRFPLQQRWHCSRSYPNRKKKKEFLGYRILPQFPPGSRCQSPRGGWTLGKRRLKEKNGEDGHGGGLCDPANSYASRWKVSRRLIAGEKKRRGGRN